MALDPISYHAKRSGADNPLLYGLRGHQAGQLRSTRRQLHAQALKLDQLTAEIGQLKTLLAKH